MSPLTVTSTTCSVSPAANVSSCGANVAKSTPSVADPPAASTVIFSPPIAGSDSCTVNEAITVLGVSPSVTETSSTETERTPSSLRIVPDPDVAFRTTPALGLSSVSVTCSSPSIVLSPLTVTTTGVVSAPATSGTVTLVSPT